MEMTWRAGAWRQFRAAIDMLENAITACPDELWQARLYDEKRGPPDFAAFWYIAFHALFWLDFYLADTAEGFAPPAPFTLSEFDPDSLLPDRVYSKAELRTYLDHGREKCRAKQEGQADLLVPQGNRPGWTDMSVAELTIYNIRHIQEHAAQLSLFLGQQLGSAPGWVSKGRNL
jgi:hypothetical protein